MTDSTLLPDVDTALFNVMMEQRKKTKERQAKHYRENKEMLLKRRQENRVKARKIRDEKYESGELERPKRGRPPLPPELKKPPKKRVYKPKPPKKSPMKRGAKPKRVIAKTKVEDDRVVILVQNPTDKPIEYKYINTPEVKFVVEDDE